MSDLYREIEAHLEQHAQKMAGRRRFASAMQRADFQAELWEAVSPFIRTPADRRAAVAFMAAMLGRDGGH